MEAVVVLGRDRKLNWSWGNGLVEKHCDGVRDKMIKYFVWRM